MNKLIILVFFSFIFCQNQKYLDLLNQTKDSNRSSQMDIESQLEREYNQARSLEKSGLINEAMIIYKKLNEKSPDENRYYKPIKKFYKQTESWDSLFIYIQKYSKARNNDLQSKIEFLDYYVTTNQNEKWTLLANDLILNSSLDQRSIKNIIQHLISIGEFDYTYELLIKFRIQNNKKDFYSIELASYLGMRMSFEKATYEYLIYLDAHPKQFQMISDRIMAFPNESSINEKIKSILIKSDVINAQFILADIQFKLKEFDNAYKTLIKSNCTSSMLFDFGKDLYTVGEYIRAENVFNEVMGSTNNEKLLTDTIFEIAKIFESKLTVSKKALNISGFYANNSFFTSPFLSIKKQSGSTLKNTMKIYDSLRVSKKNAQAAFRLAEVQYRILGDLDRALYLYQEASKYGNTLDLRIDSAIGILDVYMSKGDLTTAKNKCDNLITKYPTELIFQIKYAQILFYDGNYSDTETALKSLIKEIPSDNKSFNDIMDILSILILFKNHQKEFIDFTKVQFNIFQNKRTEALENLTSLFNTEDIYINDMCRYQYAWVLYLHGDIEKTKLFLKNINGDSIYKELAHIFHAEILDYINYDISKSIDIYLNFLDLYPQSIFYDDIRLRLRKLAS